MIPRESSIRKTWITGLIDEDEMKAEFGLHYKKIMDDPALQKIYIHGEDPADQKAKSRPEVKITDLARIH
jgi:hypothetical protein